MNIQLQYEHHRKSNLICKHYSKVIVKYLYRNYIDFHTEIEMLKRKLKEILSYPDPANVIPLYAPRPGTESQISLLLRM